MYFYANVAIRWRMSLFSNLVSEKLYRLYHKSKDKSPFILKKVGWDDRITLVKKKHFLMKTKMKIIE